MSGREKAEAHWSCRYCGATGTVEKGTDAPKGTGTYARAYPYLLAARALQAHNENCPQRPAEVTT